MFDAALTKDLAELLGKQLTFKDIEAVGGYVFKDHGYRTHAAAGVDKKVSISPLNAARQLVLEGVEHLLYDLSRTGVYYDFDRRRFVEFNTEKKSLPNWGALRRGREYPLAVASVDICQNSELVRKYKPAVMEKIYYRLWEFLKQKLEPYDGRIWSWAGDGGLFAFRGEDAPAAAVSCCLEILYTLPVFNLQPGRPVREELCLRIVSETINYAAHLEKKGTQPMGLSVSDTVYEALPPSLRKVFKRALEFEGRSAHSTG